MRIMSVAGVLLLAGSLPAAAQERFQWRGVVDPGAALEVRAVNGSIRSVPVDAGDVRVDAVRRTQSGDEENVTVEVLEHSGGVTICAVYPSPGLAGRVLRVNKCRPGGSSINVNSSAVVDFVVYLPQGTRLIASTVNGDVHVTTSGSASANTINGDITFALPADAYATVTAYTFNGRFVSDFEVELRPSLTGRIRGTLGSGPDRTAADLRATSMNGSVLLRRSQD